MAAILVSRNRTLETAVKVVDFASHSMNAIASTSFASTSYLTLRKAFLPGSRNKNMSQLLSRQIKPSTNPLSVMMSAAPQTMQIKSSSPSSVISNMSQQVLSWGQGLGLTRIMEQVGTNGVWSSLRELFSPGWVLAVPKSKTSHSKKRMRSATKGLKEKTNIVNCTACGGPKVAHHVCITCHREFSREYQAEKRAAQSAQSVQTL